MGRRPGFTSVAVLATVLAVVPGPGNAAASRGTGGPAARTTSPAATSVLSADNTGVVFSEMSEAQRIGQLFMIGTPASSVGSATLAAIENDHVGNVILTGRSSAGVTATRAVTDTLQAHATAAATDHVPLFIATDQEGGQVQVLSGPGFSTIPSALTQGTWSTSALEGDARVWGRQLAAAGVNINLAPVMDTVPVGQVNPPIGGYDREYGHTTAVVGTHGVAVAEGMAQAGVAATVKHFPGLGRVTANPDVSSGVTDRVTTYDDPFLVPFHQAVRAGAPFAMMSTAFYAKIDPAHPAAFSSKIIGGMLRSEMGFRGVVISDDLGAAAQVAAWSPGQRAVDFINAGGDMVLTVTPTVIPAMIQAVTSATASNTTFRARVDAAALRILSVKLAGGRLPAAAVSGDFTGDRRSDLAVWRPSNGTWYVRGVETVQWGQRGDVPVSADYTGDGRADLAVWRPSNGTWYIRGVETVHWGRAGAVPVPADYTGDGLADLALWRPSTGTWWIRHVETVHWGQPGDTRVPADYTGDGRADLAVWRPSNGTWYIRGVETVQWGRAGDVPV